MSKFGKYDPSEAEHGSSLFSYGEVPVVSSKLNIWNGNIEASLNWALRNIADAATIAPDGDPEGKYFAEKVSNTLAEWTKRMSPCGMPPRTLTSLTACVC